LSVNSKDAERYPLIARGRENKQTSSIPRKRPSENAQPTPPNKAAQYYPQSQETTGRVNFHPVSTARPISPRPNTYLTILRRRSSRFNSYFVTNPERLRPQLHSMYSFNIRGHSTTYKPVRPHRTTCSRHLAATFVRRASSRQCAHATKYPST
jgi:hypothetical protein